MTVIDIKDRSGKLLETIQEDFVPQENCAITLISGKMRRVVEVQYDVNLAVVALITDEMED